MVLDFWEKLGGEGKGLVLHVCMVRSVRDLC